MDVLRQDPVVEDLTLQLLDLLGQGGRVALEIIADFAKAHDLYDGVSQDPFVDQ